MNRRWLVSLTVVAVHCVVVPSKGLAQAMTPFQGDSFFSLNYQFLGTDERASTIAQVFAVDGDVGLTDRLALSAELNYLTTKWTGSGTQHNPLVDSGSWNAAFQDARVGVRYQALDGSAWMLTPSVAVVLPVTDYEFSGHAALGLGLKELQLGMSVGRFFNLFGQSRAYFEGSYFYSFLENGEHDPSRCSCRCIRSNIS